MKKHFHFAAATARPMRLLPQLLKTLVILLFVLSREQCQGGDIRITPGYRFENAQAFGANGVIVGYGNMLTGTNPWTIASGAMIYDPALSHNGISVRTESVGTSLVAIEDHIGYSAPRTNLLDINTNSGTNPDLLAAAVGYDWNTGVAQIVWKAGGSWHQKPLPFYSVDAPPASAGQTWGWATRINNRYEVLENSADLIRNGLPVSLDEKVSGWGNIWVADINNKGTIVATAKKLTDNNGHPIPPAQQSLYPVLLLPVDLVPDFNRDGKIDDKDRGKITSEKPFRFWVNDDDDKDDMEGTDIPGQGANYSKINIQGTRDLIDYFPLWLDLKTMLAALPPGNGISYNLKHETGGIRFAYTDLKPDDCKAYLTKKEVDGEKNDAIDLSGATSVQATAAGVPLNTDWLNKIKDNGEGILLISCTSATDSSDSGKPLILEVKKGSDTLCEIKFYIRASGVEKFYRSLNILSTNGQSGGRATDLNEPSNYPDSLCNNKNFVLVHGYNVNAEQARGWSAEFFKKLWQSGSKAKFTGVTWYGSQTQNLLIPGVTSDYQTNVQNAFGCASALQSGLASLQGPINIAGHSLGNMLVSSAIKDWSLSVANYFMIDAAVAKESYDANEDDTTTMTDPTWESYDPQLRATNWYKLPWTSGDNRARLTWNNRLGPQPNGYNIYSSGEEVLQNPPHGPAALPTSGTLVWAAQEKRKGYGLTGYVLTSTYGGWNYNAHPDYGTPQYDPFLGRIGFIPKTQAELGPVDAAFKEKLKTTPFFNPGFDSFTNDINPNTPADIKTLYGPGGSAYASPEQNRNMLLAKFIPAKSHAAGSNRIGNFSDENGDRNYDMNTTEFKPNGWPRTENKWHHSDIREVSYIYTFKVFEKIVEIGALK